MDGYKYAYDITTNMPPSSKRFEDWPEDTKEAYRELEAIRNGTLPRKRYATVDELVADLEKENDL